MGDAENAAETSTKIIKEHRSFGFGIRNGLVVLHLSDTQWLSMEPKAARLVATRLVEMADLLEKDGEK